MITAKVLGGAPAHLIISFAVTVFPVPLVSVINWKAVLPMPIKLSFSSTVFPAKTFKKKKGLRAFHGWVVIGIADRYWNEYGHQVTAETIAQFVDEYFFAPSSGHDPERRRYTAVSFP